MKRPFGKFWPDTFLARKRMAKIANRDLSSELVVFTGGTDGMGRLAVERFAQMGASICLLGRNLEKTYQVRDQLVGSGYPGEFTVVECDLSSLESVRKAAGEILNRYESIDYLINCAGINVPERRLTVDGLEMNFTVNYLGPFLLTELLLERVKSSLGARIIHLSSATQEVAKLKLDDLQSVAGWSVLHSYAQAKLCMVMHAKDLAQRLEGSAATINSLNPGYVRTNLGRYLKGPERWFGLVFNRLAAPTWVGAERVVAAALEPTYASHSGEFIYEDLLLAPNPQALAAENITQLMVISRALTELDISAAKRVA